ncbi:RNA-binding protein Nova-1, putative [Perkinsus marinus ATCC 50983]|uniref:RNA-binding protein Nova-1, putative n=1 Tax=Perkinsus marinus (strain ATCC 50983 / TXsc) TaxID=423536 RepID=C5KR17_PERM5|nr:RNA-binding protein Nova-1, putative [Perkinsus marinus ATCC 50983]XP_002781278.1 RNA-binding protein Nova-1, putative [Perkinsus marinus ATCC 50983]EER07128.1 RNA-binding protein Nova-1, putative [Perkinsus marinus ATCC 50983]EER13073.1 RNA-binding protein Nova-1, putative [Perkinsus marinus ATCC 50983]|eukprot:XP_002775312.1 RNA-binding protein Nova-1, putative [Perkinsus marinus ATCC 50983]
MALSNVDVEMAELAALRHQGVRSIPSRSTRKRKARAKLAARVRDERYKAGPFWFKLLISEGTAGVIMGHGGSTLISLEKETLTAMKLSPYGSYFPNSNLRVLVIAAPSLEAMRSVVMKVVHDYILADIAVESVYICLGSPTSVELARAADITLSTDEFTLQHGGETVMEVSILRHGADRRLTALACGSIALAVQSDRSHLANTVKLVYDPLAILPGDIDAMVDAHFCNIVFECSNAIPPAFLTWISTNCHVEIDIQSVHSGKEARRLIRIEGTLDGVHSATRAIVLMSSV